VAAAAAAPAARASLRRPNGALSVEMSGCVSYLAMQADGVRRSKGQNAVGTSSWGAAASAVRGLALATAG
jgi:hypothetical protein